MTVTMRSQHLRSLAWKLERLQQIVDEADDLLEELDVDMRRLSLRDMKAADQ